MHSNVLQLSTKYKIVGIPSLIILDENAQVLTSDGVQLLLQDRSGDALMKM